MIYVAARTENAIEKPQKCIMNPVARAQTGAEMLPMEKKALNAATRSSSPPSQRPGPSLASYANA